MELNEIMNKIEVLGSQQIKNVLVKHGICEPFFGAKITDLKKLVKFVKKNDELAKTIGKVNVSMGKTSCKVPLAEDYIEKMITMNKIGIKRKKYIYML